MILNQMHQFDISFDFVRNICSTNPWHTFQNILDPSLFHKKTTPRFQKYSNYFWAIKHGHRRSELCFPSFSNTISFFLKKIQANWTLCKLKKKQHIQTQFKIYKFKVNHDIGHISVLCINDLKFWENDNGKSAASYQYLVTYHN